MHRVNHSQKAAFPASNQVFSQPFRLSSRSYYQGLEDPAPAEAYALIFSQILQDLTYR